jgi:hypothetical protein
MIENEPIMVQALHQLALTRVLAGRPGEALAFLDEAAPLVRRAGLRNAATYCLDVIAAVALERGDPATAADALAVADRVRHALRTPVWPTVESFVAGLSERARAALAGSGGVPETGWWSLPHPDHDPFAAVESGLAAVR